MSPRPRLVAAAVAAASVAAGALAAPAPAAENRFAASLSIGDGTVWLIVKAKTSGRLTKAKAVATHPCLSYTYDDGRTQLCVRDEKWVKVRSTGAHARSPLLVPYGVQRLSRRRLVFLVRQADVMLPAGRAVADAWCSGCRRSPRPARVFPLRMRSCEAARPWLVHGAPRPIGKAVAITFDDGPGAMTPAVLRILKRERVPTTFFPVGQMIEQRPQLLPRIAAEGHVIGNHTWSHPLMHAGARQQLTDVNSLVKKLTGFRPCLFRAPYGENPPDVVALARSVRLTTVHWNVDPGDWRGASAAEIVRTATSQTRPGSIAVFHDGGTHRQVLAALPAYIDELKRRDYRFLTVPELLGLPVSYVARR